MLRDVPGTRTRRGGRPPGPPTRAERPIPGAREPALAVRSDAAAGGAASGTAMAAASREHGERPSLDRLASGRTADDGPAGHRPALLSSPHAAGGTGPYGVAAPRILIVDDDPNLLVDPRGAAAGRRLRGPDRARRRRGPPPARQLLAGPPDHRHADAAHGRPDPRARDQGPRGPPDHRPLRHRHRGLEGRPARRGRRGLRHQALPLPGAAGPRARASCAGSATASPASAWSSAPTSPWSSTGASADGRRRRPSPLTPTESRLLYALAANLGQTVTTETLLARGWADTEDADPSYVWVTMRRLRQKVEARPQQAAPTCSPCAASATAWSPPRRRPVTPSGRRGAAPDRRPGLPAAPAGLPDTPRRSA